MQTDAICHLPCMGKGDGLGKTKGCSRMTKTFSMKYNQRGGDVLCVGELMDRTFPIFPDSASLTIRNKAENLFQRSHIFGHHPNFKTFLLKHFNEDWAFAPTSFLARPPSKFDI